MRNLIDRHKEENRSLRKRAKATEAMAKRVKEDQIAKVGKIQVALDERASKVKSLRTRLQMSEDQAAATEERTQTVEQRRASVERDQATFKEAWKISLEESASLKRDMVVLES